MRKPHKNNTYKALQRALETGDVAKVQQAVWNLTRYVKTGRVPTNKEYKEYLAAHA